MQSARSLTDRQRAVMERIDRRVPIKVIAQELGISETRINQHIRALKDAYQAENLNQLVELYRLEKPFAQQEKIRDLSALFDVKLRNSTGFSGEHKSIASKVFSNHSAIGRQRYGAAKSVVSEPRTIIGFLDNQNAMWNRLGVIAAVFSLLLSFTVLAVAASNFIFAALG
ncbi:MAG: LuxR C-terminal-related transcriptional regulator [Erythrobacter sp.]